MRPSLAVELAALVGAFLTADFWGTSFLGVAFFGVAFVGADFFAALFSVVDVFTGAFEENLAPDIREATFCVAARDG